MRRFIIRRLLLAVATIFGVMLLTFAMFRLGAGDVAAAHLPRSATTREKAQWRHKYGYDLPTWINLHSRLVLTDTTDGDGVFIVDAGESLGLIVPVGSTANTIVGRFVYRLNDTTPVGQAEHILRFTLADSSEIAIDPAGAKTYGELIELINTHPLAGGRIVASISARSAGQLRNSQFFRHLVDSITFSSRSLRDNRRLIDIIVARAPASLAVTIPAMALSWAIGLAAACLVAYHRQTWIDKLGVLLCVFGACVPFLALMIFAQWAMFAISPRHAYGVLDRRNVYLPIVIMVLASLGPTVRFYRTVILDQINCDYVRTARAKGLAPMNILFVHVLKNCMPAILTNLIVAIPFMITGSVLIESYFGIPGLGDLMVNSIQNRDEAIISGMVLLTALAYTLGVLITDISYAAFDPRIRLE